MRLLGSLLIVVHSLPHRQGAHFTDGLGTAVMLLCHCHRGSPNSLLISSNQTPFLKKALLKLARGWQWLLNFSKIWVRKNIYLFIWNNSKLNCTDCTQATSFQQVQSEHRSYKMLFLSNLQLSAKSLNFMNLKIIGLSSDRVLKVYLKLLISLHICRSAINKWWIHF